VPAGRFFENWIERASTAPTAVVGADSSLSRRRAEGAKSENPSSISGWRGIQRSTHRSSVRRSAANHLLLDELNNVREPSQQALALNELCSSRGFRLQVEERDAESANLT
jgi:hypothetical protein